VNAMKQSTYPQEHLLQGKTAAVTGSTGGLGQALCLELARMGADLVLIDRNPDKQAAHIAALKEAVPSLSVTGLIADLSDMTSVRSVTERLLISVPDIMIHNAGAYSIPRYICDTGLDNVFQINFVSPYYMIRRLLPALEQKGGRVVVVGSIAHNYSKTDPRSMDFADRRAASKVYGNAKRWLMAAVSALAAEHPAVPLCITHPGISFTGITAHYPPWLFAIIRHPMKWIFMKPHNACRSILQGVFEPCAPDEWIGPCLFDVWGAPKRKRLRTISDAERRAVAIRADRLYSQLEE